MAYIDQKFKPWTLTHCDFWSCFLYSICIRSGFKKKHGREKELFPALISPRVPSPFYTCEKFHSVLKLELTQLCKRERKNSATLQFTQSLNHPRSTKAKGAKVKQWQSLHTVFINATVVRFV